MSRLSNILSVFSFRLIFGLILIFIIFHSLRVLIEVQQIKYQIDFSAKKYAQDIETAHQIEDLFLLRKVLRDIKPESVNWLSFEDNLSNKLQSGPLLIGNLNSDELSQKSYTLLVNYRGNSLGIIRYGLSPLDVSAHILKENYIYYLLISFFIILVFSFVFFELIKTAFRVESDLESLVLAIDNSQNDFSKNFLNKLNETSKKDGFSGAYAKHLTRVIAAIKRVDAVEQRNRMLELHALLAKQVSHDIRSPLSALNIAISEISNLPFEHKNLIKHAIQRINEIANDLLLKSKIMDSEKKGILINENSNILLQDLVEALISEKKIQYKNLYNLTIKTDYKKNIQVFISANSKEFSRLLSNIITNSIESLDNLTGEIVIGIRDFKEVVQLTVLDNGVGIPPDILNQVGQKGFTHGKLKKNNGSGSGLGLFHAKSYIEQIGGRLTIHSQIGEGTIVDIQIPKAQISR